MEGGRVVRCIEEMKGWLDGRGGEWVDVLYRRDEGVAGWKGVGSG